MRDSVLVCRGWRIHLLWAPRRRDHAPCQSGGRLIPAWDRRGAAPAAMVAVDPSPSWIAIINHHGPIASFLNHGSTAIITELARKEEEHLFINDNNSVTCIPSRSRRKINFLRSRRFGTSNLKWGWQQERNGMEWECNNYAATTMQYSYTTTSPIVPCHGCMQLQG